MVLGVRQGMYKKKTGSVLAEMGACIREILSMLLSKAMS